MDVFQLRNQLIRDYENYSAGFTNIRDKQIADHVATFLEQGVFRPNPLIQLNPIFKRGACVIAWRPLNNLSIMWALQLPKHPITGNHLFAFRLHQFINPVDT